YRRDVAGWVARHLAVVRLAAVPLEGVYVPRGNARPAPPVEVAITARTGGAGAFEIELSILVCAHDLAAAPPDHAGHELHRGNILDEMYRAVHEQGIGPARVE